MTNVYVASDHAGFELKKIILDEMKGAEGYEFLDLGTESKESCDYPIFAQRVVKRLKMYDDSLGVLICGTGIGMSIAANRYEWIRAALCFNEKMAEMSRRHNDANVIVFGAKIISPEEALKSLKRFLSEDFEGETRHLRRLNMINQLTYGEDE